MRTIQRVIAGAFIFSNDGHILLGRNGKGGVYENVWVIPGGGVEAGESKLDAMKRETLEEVGIDVSNAIITPIDLPLSGVAEKTLRDTNERVLVQMQFNNFRVNMPFPASEITIKLEDDLSNARWFSFAELSSLRFSPSVKQTLQFLGYLN